MKLTSKEARNLLEIERKTAKNDRWIEHCICVGDSAGKIAEALNEKGYDVDIDKTITLGYLHDIGKYNGESHGHEISGYNYLKDKEYDEELEFMIVGSTEASSLNGMISNESPLGKELIGK